MSFRQLQIDPSRPQTLSDELSAPVTYSLPKEAAQAYQSVYDAEDCPFDKPWLRPADARRLSNRVGSQIKKDWPQIRSLVSEEEALRVMRAYRHLSGTLMAWEHIDQLITDNKSSGENVLRRATIIRDDLLALGQVAYRGNEELKQRMDDIRALSQPNNSLYDEAHHDLLASVNLFETNPFTKKGVIEYPTEMLKEATELAHQLPLLRPTNNAKTPAEASPSNELPPLLYRAFGVFASCYQQLIAVGHFLHFANKKSVSLLYPRLASTTIPSQDKEETTTDTNTPEATADTNTTPSTTVSNGSSTGTTSATPLTAKSGA